MAGMAAWPVAPACPSIGVIENVVASAAGVEERAGRLAHRHLPDMLHPRHTPTQRRLLPVNTALLTSVGVLATAHAHWPHASAGTWLWPSGVAALTSALLASWMILRSPWGSRFQILAPWGVTLLILVPWSLALAPHVWGHVSWWFSGSVALALLLALPLSALWHARRCTPVQPNRRTLWPGSSLRLRDATVHPPEPTQGTALIPPQHAALISIPAFAVLRAFLPSSTVVLLAFLLAFLGSLALVCGPLGRARGEGWRLRQIERQMGVRFVHILRAPSHSRRPTA